MSSSLKSGVLVLLIAIGALIPGSESTNCYVQNSILNVMSQVCPANIYQCMKFKCRFNNNVSGQRKFEQITKGCNDPNNPPVSCTSIMTNCQSLGGTGQCYTCTGDYCNFVSRPIGIFLAVLAPMLTYLMFY